MHYNKKYIQLEILTVSYNVNENLLNKVIECRSRGLET